MGKRIAYYDEDASYDGKEACVQIEDLHVGDRGDVLDVKVLGVALRGRSGLCEK